MDAEINMRDLAALIRAKRGARGLRAVAQEIGEVSASTLSRVEQGKVPDLETFARLCRWLGVSPERFLPGTGDADRDAGAPGSQPEMSRQELITAHLRADRILDPATAQALATMVRLAYVAAERGELIDQADTRVNGATRVQDMG